MRPLIALLLICACLPGCDTTASGRVEGGRTDLSRDVATDAGHSRNYRKRVVVIGEAPAPVKK